MRSTTFFATIPLLGSVAAAPAPAPAPNAYDGPASSIPASWTPWGYSAPLQSSHSSIPTLTPSYVVQTPSYASITPSRNSSAWDNWSNSSLSHFSSKPSTTENVPLLRYTQPSAPQLDVPPEVATVTSTAWGKGYRPNGPIVTGLASSKSGCSLSDNGWNVKTATVAVESSGSASGSGNGYSPGSSSGSGLSDGSNSGSGSGSNSGSGSGSGMASTALQSTPALGSRPTLTPCLPADLDTSGLSNLSPDDTGTLMYSPGTTGGASHNLSAYMSPNFTYPTVVLEHSDYVTYINFATDSCTVTFSSSSALNHVESTWSSGEILLVTHASGCGASSVGQRCYWLASSITFDTVSLTATCPGKLVTLQEAMSDVHLSWGPYQPAKSKTIPSGGSANTTSSGGSSGQGKPSGSGGSGLNSSTSTSSSAAATYTACGAVPAPTILGFPAIACGTDFDQELDDALGYYLMDQENFSASLHAIAPGLNDTDYADYNSNTTSKSRRSIKHELLRRGWFDDMCDAVSSAVSDVVSAVVDVADAVVQVAEAVADTVVELTEFVAGVIVAVVDHSFSPSVSVTLPVDVGPSSSELSDSPWGDAYIIAQFTPSDDDSGDEDEDEDVDEFEAILDQVLPDDNQQSTGVTFYCVDCGIQGSVSASGSISFSLLDGVTAGSLSLSGSIDAGLQIGVDAFAEMDEDITVARLVHQGLPGFSIPDVVTVGPEITLDMVAHFGITAEGQLLAGVTMNMDEFEAYVDLFDSSNSFTSGFTPELSTIFNASGELTATASLGLPLGLAFGIDLLAGKYTKDIALVDTPALEVIATLTGSYVADSVNGTSNTTASINDGTCPGISWEVDVTNGLELDVLGLRTYDLYDWTSPDLASGCITVFKDYALPTSIPNPTQTSTTTSAPSSPPTAVANPSPPGGSQCDVTMSADAIYAEIIKVSVETDDTITGCALACLNQAGCESFTVFSGNYGECEMNTQSVGSVTISSGNTAGWIFFDVGCFEYAETNDFFRRSVYTRQDNSTSTASTTNSTTSSNNSTNSTSFSITLPAFNFTFPDFAADAPDPSAFSNGTSTNSTSTTNTTIPASGDGAVYASLVDSTGTAQLSAGSDGNLYISAAGSSDNGAIFTSYKGIFAGDDNERLFHYYNDTMAILGVSRLRLAGEDSIPLGSELVTLAPVAFSSNSPSAYVGFDTLGNLFYPIVCNFANTTLTSKVFLVSNVTQGTALLEEPQLSYIVTGAEVSQCAFLTWELASVSTS